MSISKSKFGFVVGLCTVSVLAAGEGLFRLKKHNFEKFREFELTQSPALGFCPILDLPVHASIRRESDRRYRLQLSWLEEGNPETDECLDIPNFSDCLNLDCPIIRRVPGRLLTNEEAAYVRKAFRAVKIHHWVKFDPNCGASDPSRFILARWDDVGAVEFCFPISDGVLDGGEFAKLTALFRNLDDRQLEVQEE